MHQKPVKKELWMSWALVIAFKEDKKEKAVDT